MPRESGPGSTAPLDLADEVPALRFRREVQLRTPASPPHFCSDLLLRAGGWPRGAASSDHISAGDPSWST